jgi:hypothetical protein
MAQAVTVGDVQAPRVLAYLRRSPLRVKVSAMPRNLGRGGLCRSRRLRHNTGRYRDLSGETHTRIAIRPG